MSISYELAREMKERGFPNITRWEVENNYRRAITVSGEESLPPIEAVMSEIKQSFSLEKLAGNLYLAYIERYGSEDYEEVSTYEIKKQGFDSYVDDKTYNNFYGSTPLEAVCRLWIALNKK